MKPNDDSVSGHSRSLAVAAEQIIGLIGLAELTIAAVIGSIEPRLPWLRTLVAAAALIAGVTGLVWLGRGKRAWTRAIGLLLAFSVFCLLLLVSSLFIARLDRNAQIARLVDDEPNLIGNYRAVYDEFDPYALVQEYPEEPYFQLDRIEERYIRLLQSGRIYRHTDLRLVAESSSGAVFESKTSARSAGPAGTAWEAPTTGEVWEFTLSDDGRWRVSRLICQIPVANGDALLEELARSVALRLPTN